MKQTIELNSDDIKRIMAEHFKVDESSVDVGTKDLWIGYGPGEHKVSVPYAIVTK